MPATDQTYVDSGHLLVGGQYRRSNNHRLVVRLIGWPAHIKLGKIDRADIGLRGKDRLAVERHLFTRDLPRKDVEVGLADNVVGRVLAKATREGRRTGSIDQILVFQSNTITLQLGRIGLAHLCSHLLRWIDASHTVWERIFTTRL